MLLLLTSNTILDYRKIYFPELIDNGWFQEVSLSFPETYTAVRSFAIPYTNMLSPHFVNLYPNLFFCLTSFHVFFRPPRNGATAFS